MKRFLTLLVSLTLCTGAALFADDSLKKDESMKSGSTTSGSMKSDMKSARMMTVKGTIAKMDKDGKMMTMRSSRGREMTIYWDDSTKVTGDMKPGSRATVQYMMRDGKMMAHDMKMSGGMKSGKKKM